MALAFQPEDCLYLPIAYEGTPQHSGQRFLAFWRPHIGSTCCFSSACLAAPQLMASEPAADSEIFCAHGRREHILSLHLNVERANTMPAAEGISTLNREMYVGRRSSVQRKLLNGLHACFNTCRRRYWRKHIFCYLDNSHVHPTAFLRDPDGNSSSNLSLANPKGLDTACCP